MDDVYGFFYFSCAPIYPPVQSNLLLSLCPCQDKEEKLSSALMSLATPPLPHQPF